MLNSKCIFILKEDVLKGEVFSHDNIQKVIIKNFYQEKVDIPYGKVAIENLKKGQILSNEVISSHSNFVLKEKYIIPLVNSVKDIKKGSIVNVYMTTKRENFNEFNLKKYQFIWNKESQEVTLQLLKNQEILGIYKDKDENQYIMVEIDREIVMLIENIKDVSRFNLSLMERRE